MKEKDCKMKLENITRKMMRVFKDDKNFYRKKYKIEDFSILNTKR
jgi:hypothetical protein